jgi:beta-lactam-binding protein with PASTA domain
MAFNKALVVGAAALMIASLSLAGCTSSNSTDSSKNSTSSAHDASSRTVPNVSGLTVVDARKKLTKAGLSARTSQPGTKWKVTSQFPAAGAHAPRGSAVEVEPYKLKQK